jgi:hypothetical protein
MAAPKVAPNECPRTGLLTWRRSPPLGTFLLASTMKQKKYATRLASTLMGSHGVPPEFTKLIRKGSSI